MYVTTFYSFKGGVGRTMALVNAAVTLALRGRRVLVVDFDIEAPGLDTFDLLRPRTEVPGIVDFVARYLQSGMAPDVSDYIGECPEVGGADGKLWIMPSGRNDAYATTLGQINWTDLYERHDGYVLFEDLKEQWAQTVQPDYVLIDSRTGHTDSSGICTRQLPDAVVILFFPNEQNLRGLSQVVHEIRGEAVEPRSKEIALHFVMSNVPDLDDEDQILRDKISAFRNQLGFQRDPIVVHRYDSLSLLNQVVFAKDRPRSRLAREYSRIVREISTRNWEDRDGALEYIRRAGGRRSRFEDDSILARDERLARIERAHREDGEVLFRLGELRESDRQPEAAAELIHQAILHGHDGPEAFLKRSRFRTENDEREGAIEDARRVLEYEHVSPPMIREAIGCLARFDDLDPQRVVEAKAVASLNVYAKHWLAGTLNLTRTQLLVAVTLWEQIGASTDFPQRRYESARFSLGLSCMGLGRFVEAAGYFQDIASDVSQMDIRNVFNYGMARWGIERTIDPEIFKRVIVLHQSDEGNEETANYLQCMAIAYWATGQTEEAVSHLDRAQKVLTTSRTVAEFSCWRYLEVNAGSFKGDLDQIRTMIEDRSSLILPLFMDETGGTVPGT